MSVMTVGGAKYSIVERESNGMSVTIVRTPLDLAEHAISTVLTKAWTHGYTAADDARQGQSYEVRKDLARTGQLAAAVKLHELIDGLLESWDDEG